MGTDRLVRRVRDRVFAAHSPNEVLDAVCSVVHDELGELALAGVYARDGAFFWMQAQHGYKVVNHAISADKGVIGRAVRDGRTAAVEDVAADPDFIASDPRIVSMVAVPFRLGDVVCVFSVESIGRAAPDWAPEAFERCADLIVARVAALGEPLAVETSGASDVDRMFLRIGEQESPTDVLQDVMVATAAVLAADVVRVGLYDGDRLIDAGLWRHDPGEDAAPLVEELYEHPDANLGVAVTETVNGPNGHRRALIALPLSVGSDRVGRLVAAGPGTGEARRAALGTATLICSFGASQLRALEARAAAARQAALVALVERLQRCAGAEEIGAAVVEEIEAHVPGREVVFFGADSEGFDRILGVGGSDAEHLRPMITQPFPLDAESADVQALLRGEVYRAVAGEGVGAMPGERPYAPGEQSVEVPVLEDGRYLGSLFVRRDPDQPELRDDEVALMRAFAGQAALALRAWQLRDESERGAVATVTALLEALAATDVYTFDHARELEDLAIGVARALGLSRLEIEHVALAAVLHDIGKIGIPGEILRKPGALDPAEWRLMRTHPDRGARIIEPVVRLRPCVPYVRHSHESWDGSGYPEGLEAEEIPLGARIVAVVDAFHAMTSDRPYRSALGVGAACAELERCAGTQFDPRVVEAFLELVRGAGELEQRSSAVG